MFLKNVSLVCALGLGLTAQAQEKATDTIEIQRKLAAGLTPSVVTVEYTLKYDKGEPPHGGLGAGSDPDAPSITLEGFVEQERAIQVGSYLIGPDLVISEELPLHERFIEKIEVRFKDQVVAAKPVAWAMNAHAVYLRLEKPLAGAEPIRFDATAAGPYMALMAAPENASMAVLVTPFSPQLADSRDLGAYVQMPREAVMMNKEGVAAGMSMSPVLPVGQDWKGSPGDWSQFSAEQRSEVLARVGQVAEGGVVRATLNFRSPKKGAEAELRARMRNPGGEDDEEATERHVAALLLSNGHVLIPLDLKPNVTARLDRIRLFTADGKERTASFIGSLKDYGALIAKLDEPADGLGVPLRDGAPFDGFNEPVVHAEVEVRGEERLAYLDHRRVLGFQQGWRNRAYPLIADDAENSYLFSVSGELAAFPLATREKPTAQPRWNSSRPMLTPSVYLLQILSDLPAALDSSNIPLGEDQENRLAWLGVVLQPLDRELARANKVAEYTQDGRIGALVNFIYPGSPAAEAGVEPGWILVRLHIEGNPQPVNVQVDELSAGFPLPWDRLDELPEQLFERIPQPWPAAENQLTSTLTEVGFGTKFTADFFNDGQKITKEFAVVQSPAHYNSAPKYKHDELGATVRDVTYEVRNYFQLEDDAPGVIVSRLEPGSKGSVAGIKPYELVTHVNGKAVKNVGEFEAALEPGELRLTVQRMTRTRQVMVKLDGAAAPLPATPAPGADQ